MFNVFGVPELELPESFPEPSALFTTSQPVNAVPSNKDKAQVIREAIAYLKKTPAVTLVGKGGAYELLEKYAEDLENS